MLLLFVGPTRVYLFNLFLLRYSASLTVKSLSFAFISVLYLDLFVLGDDALIS